jgi:DNA-binding GntR family transcriptional regulator
MLNHEFHGHIHNTARAPEIAKLAKSFWDRSDFHLATTPQSHIYAERLEIATHQHGDIITLIEDGNQKRAEKLMLNHVLGFRDAIIRALDAAKTVERPRNLVAR